MRAEHLDSTETVVASGKLLDLFLGLDRTPFLFVEPGGNFGDHLIYRGAERLAEVAGIEYTRLDHEEFLQYDISPDHGVYIHGSGGFNPFWSGTPILELRWALQSRARVVVLGPSTFVTDEDFLQRTVVADLENFPRDRVFVFAREARSYAVLRELLPGRVELDVDHDTALNVRPADLTPTSPSGRYDLYGIRRDKEAIPFESSDPFGIWLDPVWHCEGFDGWIDLHHGARRIVTNRLHSAIAGSVLGVSTTLLPNSYHKNRSVWEYSLEDRGVEWSEDIPASDDRSWISRRTSLFERDSLAWKGIQAALRYAHGL